MSVFLCACVYVLPVFVLVCIHVCACVFACVRMCVSVLVFVCVNVCACVCLCVPVSMCVPVLESMCANVYAFVCVHAHLCMMCTYNHLQIGLTETEKTYRDHVNLHPFVKVHTSGAPASFLFCFLVPRDKSRKPHFSLSLLCTRPNTMSFLATRDYKISNHNPESVLPPLSRFLAIFGHRNEKGSQQKAMRG